MGWVLVIILNHPKKGNLNPSKGYRTSTTRKANIRARESEPQWRPCQTNFRPMPFKRLSFLFFKLKPLTNFLSKYTILIYIFISNSQAIMIKLQELSPQFLTLILIKRCMSCAMFPRDRYPGFQVHSSLTFPSGYLISGPATQIKQ